MKLFFARTQRLVVMAVTAVWMTGCLSSTHSLPNQERIQSDSPLIGYWHGVVASSNQNTLQMWSVFHFGGSHYSVVMSNTKAYPKADFDLVTSDEDNHVFDVYASKIAGETYLALKGIRGSDIRDYLIVKYKLEKDTLRVFNINDAAIKRGVESKQLRARKDSGSYTITSRPGDLAQWLETLTPFDFESYGTYKKSDLDPRELTHRLLSLIPSKS